MLQTTSFQTLPRSFSSPTPQTTLASHSLRTVGATRAVYPSRRDNRRQASATTYAAAAWRQSGVSDEQRHSSDCRTASLASLPVFGKRPLTGDVRALIVVHAPLNRPRHRWLMTRDDNSELARLAERLDRLEKRLAGIERTANSIHDLVQARLPRRWREKFRSRLWHYRQYTPHVLDVPNAYALQVAPEKSPRIAVVTPSYNHASYLRATIDSVLAQTYPNLAYIVEDGGSTDGTTQLLESYGDRIAWRSGRDTGQGSAINRGFTRIDGEIMAYLNSDDILLPGALAYVAQTFLDNSDVDIIYGHRIFIDEDGLEIGRWVLPPHDRKTLKWADYIPQETMFWRRQVWEKLGQFDESFHYAIDWDFALRAQAAGFRFKRVPRFLACFRVHDQQKSTAMMEVGSREQRRLRHVYLGYDPDRAAVHRATRGYLRRHVLFHGLYRLGLLKY